MEISHRAIIDVGAALRLRLCQSVATMLKAKRRKCHAAGEAIPSRGYCSGEVWEKVEVAILSHERYAQWYDTEIVLQAPLPV